MAPLREAKTSSPLAIVTEAMMMPGPRKVSSEEGLGLTSEGGGDGYTWESVL